MYLQIKHRAATKTMPHPNHGLAVLSDVAKDGHEVCHVLRRPVARQRLGDELTDDGECINDVVAK